MVEVDDVILDGLGADDQIAKQPRVGRRRRTYRVLDGADRRDRVNGRAHTADALRERPRVARIAPLQDDFDPAEHRRRRPRVADDAAVDFCLDPKVAFDARDGIDNDAGSSRISLRRSASAESAPPCRRALRDLNQAVAGERGAHAEHGERADRVDIGACAETGNAHEMLIERASCDPRSPASEQPMHGWPQPIGQFVPPFQRTFGQFWNVDRPLASHLVEAVAGAMSCVAPRSTY